MTRSVHSLEKSLLCRIYKEEAIFHSLRELESLRIAKIRTLSPVKFSARSNDERSDKLQSSAVSGTQLFRGCVMPLSHIFPDETVPIGRAPSGVA